MLLKSIRTEIGTVKEIRTVKRSAISVGIKTQRSCFTRGYHPVPEADCISIELKDKAAINIDGQWAK